MKHGARKLASARSAEDTEPPNRRPLNTLPAQDLPACEAAALRAVPADKVIRTFEAIKPSAGSKAFIQSFFPEINPADWNDWHWQLRNRVQSPEGLERVLELSDSEKSAVRRRRRSLPFTITPYFLSLLHRTDPAHPLRRTMVPVLNEFDHAGGEAEDPLGEDAHTPVPGLVHRYPDRVLFLVSARCAAYCRYCTRSRMMANYSDDYTPVEGQWEAALDYIAAHPEVRDVLISGGDPLMLADEQLDYLLGRVRCMPHVEFVRLGTKAPVVLPQRITRSFIRMLKKHKPVWVSLHFTHPDEITPEVEEACARLADAGMPLGSQTVLLKGINDDPAVMRRLMHGLLKIRVRPYYLYQCDPIIGSGHFRTPVSKGLDIVRSLRGFTTGYAVPNYVIDAPGGGGKIPLLPEYVVGRDGGDLLLKNFEGETFRYPDYACAPSKPKDPEI